jgi:hypothetical protein
MSREGINQNAVILNANSSNPQSAKPNPHRLS